MMNIEDDFLEMIDALIVSRWFIENSLRQEEMIQFSILSATSKNGHCFPLRYFIDSLSINFTFR